MFNKNVNLDLFAEEFYFILTHTSLTRQEKLETLITLSRSFVHELISCTVATASSALDHYLKSEFISLLFDLETKKIKIKNKEKFKHFIIKRFIRIQKNIKKLKLVNDILTDFNTNLKVIELGTEEIDIKKNYKLSNKTIKKFKFLKNLDKKEKKKRSQPSKLKLKQLSLFS